MNAIFQNSIYAETITDSQENIAIQNMFESMLPDEQSDYSSDLQLGKLDWVGISLLPLLITSILIIGGWSGILLAAGIEEGGGPLGTIARALHIHCLICMKI